MTKKPKGFGEPLTTKDQQKALAKFKRKVETGFLKDQIAGIVTNPKGEVKMSEVIEEFVDPYLEYAENYEQQMKLLSIAIFAWNIALLPKNQRKKEVTKIVGELCANADRLAKKDTTAILEELIDRKLKMFPTIERYVLDFDLKNTRKGFHLSVVSTMPPSVKSDE